ncbi:FAD-linked oxidase [Sorangium cellulosum]|uniref:FAD-linked oxidase n=1 Tax=Sorangium cellulosum TaxID=56 RepID=A0A2L0F4H3_SORCE|nr:cholesterol oxidase substrate-binding domain-containing protein [Sorangium cellulosum]AUX46488.1 FAD-linked oxidase [Sorangium cellulosum]
MNLSRRRFLRSSATLAAGAAGARIFKVTPANADVSCPPPPGFPAGIELYQQGFENWAGDIVVDDLWTCAPRTDADLVALANWAYAAGYTLRARGKMHTWSPLTVTPETSLASALVVLVDTTQHLTAMQIVSASPAAVKVQTGATMEDLLTFLEQAGYGLTATPAPGDLTIGGVLAIGGHGTAIPAQGETRTPGHTYGSLSNLIVSLTAVVWDAALSRYELRTFDRSHPDCKAFLTHLGRAFLTEVTLRVGANQDLRCVSHVDIPATELFASPGSGAARTFQSFVEQAGRAEVIWFPFTSHPWLKVWSVRPTKPLLSRPVLSPYNYPFSDNIPAPVSDLADRIVSGEGALTPLFGQVGYDAAVAGLTATLGYDLWGKSKNLLLYVKPTTLTVTANGYAVVTSRANIQRVVAEFTSAYQSKLDTYCAQGRFPINSPVEIRVTGLDDPGDVEVAGAETPALSAARYRPDHPEWDVAVWLDVLTFPGTPDADVFYAEIEAWIFSNYTGSYATVRPEWSKGWGYTGAGAWTNTSVLTSTIPAELESGPSPGWTFAVTTLDRYDPHRVFSNPFLDALLS